MKRTVIAIATAVLAAGCSSGGASSGVRLLDEKDNGHLVHVHRGETVELRLHNTYWRVGAPSGNVLAVVSNTTHGYPPGQHCVPGGGCGTVTVRLRADHDGRTVLRAGRRSCGEARVCVGHEGSYAVTVVVA